tara:strand:- start:779 stop:1171 length:393 start_codon:yes stop_codon:yes gene_type:complete
VVRRTLMAERTIKHEIKFTEHELWSAMEWRVRDLISDRTIEYLSKEAINDHIIKEMNEIYSRIENLVHEEIDGLEDMPSDGFVNAVYITVQRCLEEILPEIHLQPQWQTSKTWEQIVKAKQENIKAKKEK